MLVCTAMIISLDSTTQLTALVWMVLGLLIYFGYSKNNSKLKA
jgi:APA family basic amino acid/polyamine antiporter